MAENLKSKPLLPDYFFITRPIIIAPIWGFCVFGYYRASLIADTVHHLGFWKIAPLGTVFPLILLLYGLLFGAIYILNQLADYETDKRTPSIWLIASDRFPKKTAIIEMVVLAVIALAGSFLHHFAPWIFIFTAIVGIIYSLPPVKLSGRPILDVLADSTVYGIAAFALGWTVAGGSFDFRMLLFSLPYFLLMGAGALNQAIPDLEDDRATGKITTAVWLGERKTSFLAVLSLISCAILSIIVTDWLCLAMALFSLLFFLQAYFRGRKVDYLRSYHIPGPFVMLAAGAVYPPLFAAMLMIYFLSRWYYPWRFGVNYPKIGN